MMRVRKRAGTPASALAKAGLLGDVLILPVVVLVALQDIAVDRTAERGGQLVHGIFVSQLLRAVVLNVGDRSVFREETRVHKFSQHCFSPLRPKYSFW